MASYNIGVDFGGTNVKLALFKDDELIEFGTYASENNRDFPLILSEMNAHVMKILSDRGMSLESVDGIGIAMPGIVDFKNKRLRSINGKYEEAVGFDIEEWIQTNMNLKCVVENDANAALLGEKAQGTIGEAGYAALFILGTGVGTAALINGDLLRGAHNQAGCLGGHFIVDYNGRACNCGSIGCLEAQASTWALPEVVKMRHGYHMSTLREEKTPQIRELVTHAAAGDDFSQMVLHEFVEKWSAGLINIIHAYDPEIIVLSGGVFNAGEVITRPLIERVRRFAWTPFGDIEIVVSNNPNQSVLYGMNYLIQCI